MRLAPRVASGPLAPMRAASAWASASSRSAGVHGEHEAEPLHLVGADLPPRADQLERPRAPDDAGKANGPSCAREPAPLRLGQREGRVRGGEAHVARQRQLGGAGASRTVERGDDDLGEGLDRIEEPVARAHQLDDLLLGIARPHRGIQDAHREELGARPVMTTAWTSSSLGQPIRDPLQRAETSG